MKRGLYTQRDTAKPVSCLWIVRFVACPTADLSQNEQTELISFFLSFSFSPL